ncbi:GAF domain-containing protein [Heliorestis acidaminivorans]|uniref:GAF domain-containing protein n=1 Tax=Heliorestis acidaminivorans TaxID=553427 RepID=A0A6I0F286_9FIRM|nr:HD domain-containing phosphohydrolase [Heliorestis acidaminivorans]KAB2953670.1 GAF domain-containing protein [Heliorestis acidaminivorans]
MKTLKSYSPETLEQVKDLLHIGIALSSEKNHDHLLELIVTEARRITAADAGTLYLCRDECLQFKIIQNETMQVFQGGNGEEVTLPPVPLKKENVSAYVALTRQIVNIPDVYNAEGFDFSGPKRYDQMTGYRTGSMLVLPLENHDNEVIGVLQLINAKDSAGQVIPFASHYEKVVASLASQAAISLTKEQLIADVEKLFQAFVEVMATAIDALSPYNAHHTRRVAELSEFLAHAINEEQEGPYSNHYFDEEHIKQIAMSAWFHDIGKVAIPLSVMDKPTRLGDQLEQVLMRLDYIKTCEERSYLRAKLAELSEGNSWANQATNISSNTSNNPSSNSSYVEGLDPDSWWAQRSQEIESARELILKANNPATFVDSALQAELQALAQHSYSNEDGSASPWLTEAELTALMVSRGTLTEEERNIMQSHVEVTNRLLEKVPFTKKLANVPRWASLHHEHLDGKGYPHGLAGEEIPVEARILAIVDVYDALTADDRPYKKAMPKERALAILTSMTNEGKLDKELLDIFKKHI